MLRHTIRSAARRSALVIQRRAAHTTDKSHRYLWKPILFGGALVFAGSSFAVSYAMADAHHRRSMRVSLGSLRRFMTSLRIGLTISLDYKWSLWRLEEVRRLGGKERGIVELLLFLFTGNITQLETPGAKVLEFRSREPLGQSYLWSVERQSEYQMLQANILFLSFRVYASDPFYLISAAQSVS